MVCFKSRIRETTETGDGQPTPYGNRGGIIMMRGEMGGSKTIRSLGGRACRWVALCDAGPGREWYKYEHRSSHFKLRDRRQHRTGNPGPTGRRQMHAGGAETASALMRTVAEELDNPSTVRLRVCR